MRAWFKVGPQPRTNWKKTKIKEIEWIKKDEESLKEFEKDLLPKLGKRTSFDSFMKKIKTSQNKVLKKRKRIRIGRRGNKKITAAEWVDIELIENINLRSRLSRRWKIARKQGEPPEVLELYEKEYKEQKKRTSIMSGRKNDYGRNVRLRKQRGMGKNSGM